MNVWVNKFLYFNNGQLIFFIISIYLTWKLSINLSAVKIVYFHFKPRKHMTEFIRSLLFYFIKVSWNFFWLTNSSQFSHKSFSTQSLHFLNLFGIATLIPNDFSQLNGTLANNLYPSNNLKFSFLSKLLLTFVKFLKVLCSSILPWLIIIKHYFTFGAKNNTY